MFHPWYIRRYKDTTSTSLSEEQQLQCDDFLRHYVPHSVYTTPDQAITRWNVVSTVQRCDYQVRTYASKPWLLYKTMTELTTADVNKQDADEIREFITKEIQLINKLVDYHYGVICQWKQSQIESDYVAATNQATLEAIRSDHETLPTLRAHIPPVPIIRTALPIDIPMLNFYDFNHLSDAIGMTLKQHPELTTSNTLSFEDRMIVFLLGRQPAVGKIQGFIQRAKAKPIDKTILSGILNYSYPDSLIQWYTLYKTYTEALYMDEDQHAMYDRWFRHPLSNALFFNTKLDDKELKELLVGIADWYLDTRIVHLTTPPSSRKRVRFHDKNQEKLIDRYDQKQIWNDAEDEDDNVPLSMVFAHKLTRRPPQDLHSFSSMLDIYRKIPTWEEFHERFSLFRNSTSWMMVDISAETWQEHERCPNKSTGYAHHRHYMLTREPCSCYREHREGFVRTITEQIIRSQAERHAAEDERAEILLGKIQKSL